MSPMPPPPAGPIAPYHVFVTAVHNSGGSPVSGAQFILKNITKATQAPAIISNETNSNIVLNIADAGAWDNGDSLELDVSYGSEAATEDTTIDTTGNPAGIELGTITLQAGSVGPIAPYHVFITAVHNSGGSPVSGAQFILKNITKATQAPAIISNETNSNIVINVADAGAWDSGDSLELDVSYGSEEATEDTTIDTTGHPAGRELGTITLQATAQEAEMTLSMSHGLANTASKTLDAAIVLSHLAGVGDSGQATVEGSLTFSELLQLIPTTDSGTDVDMVLSQSLEIGESAQATAEGVVTLSQFVGMVDGSPVESELMLSTVQSVTFTATTIVVGLITPAGRTLYVTSETLAFRIGAD